MLERLIHEPQAREIGQPLLTLSSLNKINLIFKLRSLFTISGPILWNGLNNETRIQDDVARFKVTLTKCNLEQSSYMKGTCVNLNKNLDDFFYY